MSHSALFTLVDIGASMGIDPRWEILGENLLSVGFEPNQAEYQKLTQSANRRWINAAIAEKDGPVTLNLTRAFQNSSLLEPDADILAELAWGNAHEVIQRIELFARGLDGVLGDEKLSTDFLKIDTQGTELEILRGASNQLNDSIVGVELEVSFLPYYKNQPLFAEVDAFLRSFGFECWDLGNTLRMKPRGVPPSFGPRGRLVSADALYFKNQSAIKENTNIAKNLCTALSVYGYFDESLSLARKFLLNEEATNKLSFLKKKCRRHNFTSRLLFKLFNKAAKYVEPVRHSQWVSGIGNR